MKTPRGIRSSTGESPLRRSTALIAAGLVMTGAAAAMAVPAAALAARTTTHATHASHATYRGQPRHVPRPALTR